MIKTKGKFVYEERDGVRVLYNESGVPWETNLPKDITSQQFAIDGCIGRVLTAGLGLGIASVAFLQKKDVTHLTVVEKAQEVIDLVWSNLNIPDDKVVIVCADIFDFLRDTSLEFDSAYMDICLRPTAENYRKTILPLRELAGRIIPDHYIYCWKENEMKQLAGVL